MVNQDLLKANEAMKYFENLKIDPMMVIIMLYKEYNILYLIKSKKSPKDIQNLYGKQDWQMQNYLLNAEKYSLEELKNIIITIHNYDVKLKSGILDKYVALDLLSIELCE